MTQKRKEEGSPFVRYFGPLLDALRGLGGSGTREVFLKGGPHLPRTTKDESPTHLCRSAT